MAGNVDVHYWPVSGVDTGCLAEIGTSYKPIDEGLFATDDRGYIRMIPQPNPWATSGAGSPTDDAIITKAPVAPRIRPRALNTTNTVSNSKVEEVFAVISGHTWSVFMVKLMRFQLTHIVYHRRSVLASAVWLLEIDVEPLEQT